MNAPARRRALALSLTLSLLPAHAAAQAAPDAPPQAAAQKPAAPAPAVPCDQARALALIEQQAADAKSFEPSAGKIRVMTRAASLLWPYQQEGARKIFTEAFDLAVENFRQQGEELRREGARLVSRPPDQRFEVMREIAKHDAAWARRLTERVAEESKRTAEQAGAKPPSADEGGTRLGEKMTELAMSLLDVDRQAAIELVRGSFRHPVSVVHPRFLYRLSAVDREAADRLALEAVAAYSAAGTTQDLSYLAAYVFGHNRAISPVSVSTGYLVPEGFKPSPAAQDALLKALLARAEMIIAAPERFTNKMPHRAETSSITAALLTLETLAGRLTPAQAERVTETRARVAAAISELDRQYAETHVRSDQEDDRPTDFDAEFERAEREPNADRRDQAIAFLALGVTDLEHLARLERLAEKVSDANARRQLLDWINFTRAQRLAAAGLLDEARRAADRVGELDLRSVLYFEIARESIKRLEDKARAGELLVAVASAARSAPNTALKARTQLGVAHLFSDFDSLRALEVLAEAVKTVNALEGDAELARPFVSRRIEGKTFGTYASLNVPGFSLENAFREAGARDFDGALLAARNLSDRVLRATAVTGLASRCLEQPAPRQPQQPKKLADKGRPEGQAKP